MRSPPLSPSYRFAAAGRVLLVARPVTVPECLVVLAGLVVLGLLVYIPYVRGGGFVSDDWLFHAAAQLYPLGEAIDLLTAAVPERPIEMTYQAFLHVVLGEGPRPYLVWAIATWVVAMLLLYVVLRARLEPLHAAAITTLVFLFPASDASRFWIAASVYNVALALYLGGTALALRGIGRHGRTAVVYHAGAASLYALSLLVHEIALAAIAVSVLVYRLCAPWSASIRRWLVDLVVLATAGAYVSAQSSYKVNSLDYQLDHAWTIAREARTLFSTTGILDGPVRAPTVLAAVLILAGLAVWRLLPGSDPARRELGRWLLVCTAGIVAIAAAYAPFVPANPSYHPLAAALANRTNVFASLGYGLLFYGLMMVGATLVFRGLARGRTLATAAAAAFAAVLCVTWVFEVGDHRRSYTDAANEARKAMAEVEVALGEAPAAGTTVFLFGYPSNIDGVPVFANSWDLDGAVRLRWHDRTLRGITWPTINGELPPGEGGLGRGLLCEADGLRIDGSGAAEQPLIPYGRAVFVDVGARGSVTVQDAAGCRRAVRDYLDPILLDT